MFDVTTSSPHRAFLSERPGLFGLGQPFRTTGDVVLDGPELAGDRIGYWRCELGTDRLIWSDLVYDFFGFPVGSEIPRGDVLGRYCDGSRVVLDRLRSFSIGNECGFLLDTRLSSGGEGARCVRVLSVPVLSHDRIVAIHGLKRTI